MSHKLQIGEMKASYITDQEIWSHFTYIFSSKSRNSTTYKFVLIKSIIENLYNVNEELEIHYFNLFKSFTKIYWNLVIHHKLNQINMMGKQAEVQKILLDFQAKYGIDSSFVFDKLSNEMQLNIIMKVMKRCKINVMGAVYGDTAGSIYDFDNKKETLRLNASFFTFMQRFQKILMYLTNYQLALFLEKFNINGDTKGMLIKVENVSKRSSLNQFYEVLASYFTGTCFYCGMAIRSRNAAHVDHFIPWSFVQADQLWNLVISCNACNLSKSDKLASESYLSVLIDRNHEFVRMQQVQEREDMKVYSATKLQSLYHYSFENGYSTIWVPKSS
ncbi:HNH endonuclease [Jeotgalibacillus proteolyticus]|uniref:HNH endonuclease n=1 Tax=Jeotgalibacillus proteolyticus TaxID=2082395 RepID=A0A2S5GD60_9BACL|nr:HNH endonuclease domain-containing protein [Jeotgalibacillus proteolyticus]PPA70851.1 HNH endonuclease [Jeotgalibacillus proteolyticus]